MQVSFHLRQDKIKKSGLIPIRMLISASGFKYFKVIKGIDCVKSHWDNNNQRIKTPRKNEPYNYHLEYNKILDETEAQAKKLFRYILLNEIQPTKEFVIEKMNNGLDLIKLDRAVKVSHFGRMKVSIANQLLKIDSIEV